MRMRVLLLGGESLLGQSLLRLAADENISLDAPECPAEGWRAESLGPLLAQYQPDAVVNLAFYHEQFQLGLIEAESLALQRAFALALIDYCADQDVLLLQCSGARVFDGLKATPYTEKDELSPGDALGQMQADLEQQLSNRCRRHLILRLNWVLDTAPDGQLLRLLEQLRSHEPVLLAEEWRGNPTPVEDAARVILALLKQLDCDAGLYGVYHYGSSEASSWISFAKSLAQELMAGRHIEHDPAIRSVPFDQQVEAAWEPRNAVLASRRLLMVFGVKPRAWRAQLPALLSRLRA